MSGLWKRVVTGVVALSGAAWHVLDILGRGEVATKVPHMAKEVHTFMASQGLGWELVPWFLMLGGALFFVSLQWPGWWRNIWHRGRPTTPTTALIQATPPNQGSSYWPRLTVADRLAMSAILSNGSNYAVYFVYMSDDGARLASDLVQFLESLNWRIHMRPQHAMGRPLANGIRIGTVPDGEIKNIRERSGAKLLSDALVKIGLPVLLVARGGIVDDLTIEVEVGLRLDD